MIEVNDDWYYVGLWFVPGDLQDYFAIAFRRAGDRELEAFYRFRRRGDPDPFAARMLGVTSPVRHQLSACLHVTPVAAVTSSVE